MGNNEFLIIWSFLLRSYFLKKMSPSLMALILLACGATEKDNGASLADSQPYEVVGDVDIFSEGDGDSMARSSVEGDVDSADSASVEGLDGGGVMDGGGT